MKKEKFPDVFSSKNLIEKKFSEREAIRSGGFTTVFPFEYVPSEEVRDEFEIDEREYVLKRYSSSFQDILKIAFPEDFESWTLQEKAKFLKERQARTAMFFEDITDLTVLSSNFFVYSQKGQEDGNIYEMQKRIEGQSIGQLLDENSLEWFLMGLNSEQKEKLKKNIERILKHFDDAIIRKDLRVPDTNPYNFIIDKKGNMTLIDTNVEFDWSQDLDDMSKKQKDNLEYFETIYSALSFGWV